MFKISKAEWIAAIACELASGAGAWILHLPKLAAALVVILALLILMAVLFIRVMAKYRRSEKENAVLKNQIALDLKDFMKALKEDGSTWPYRYKYFQVQHEAEIDEFGTYTGTYTHDAVNDSSAPIGSYTFVLRGTNRTQFDDLHPKAWVQWENNGPITEVIPERGQFEMPGYSNRHFVLVRFPHHVGPGNRFMVKLNFTLPKTVRSGPDGDAIDFGRFKEVNQAVIRLTFKRPVKDGKWHWLHPKNGELVDYPDSPVSGDSHLSYELHLPHTADFIRTVYGFIGIMDINDSA